MTKFKGVKGLCDCCVKLLCGDEAFDCEESEFSPTPIGGWICRQCYDTDSPCTFSTFAPKTGAKAAYGLFAKVCGQNTRYSRGGHLAEAERLREATPAPAEPESLPPPSPEPKRAPPDSILQTQLAYIVAATVEQDYLKEKEIRDLLLQQIDRRGQPTEQLHHVVRDCLRVLQSRWGSSESKAPEKKRGRPKKKVGEHTRQWLL